MPTDRDERFLIGELIREQVMLRTHEEVPYSVAVEVEGFHERHGGGVEIEASVVVEKASQKGILVGTTGPDDQGHRHAVAAGDRSSATLPRAVAPGCTRAARLEGTRRHPPNSGIRRDARLKRGAVP